MRFVLANATSALVHALALGGLALWSFDRVYVEYRVASGHVITVRFSPAADSQARQEPIAIDLSVERPRSEPAPNQISTSVERVEVPRQLAVVEIAETLIPLETPKRDAPESESSPNAPTNPRTSNDDLPDKPDLLEPSFLARKPMAEPPQREVAAIPLEFEAAAFAGSNNPDELPKKLPLNPAPPYPPAALLAGIEGRVVLRLRVAGDGSVAAATVESSSGFRSLDDSATATVRRWRFEPARKRGVPMAFDVLVPVTFRIRRG